MENVEKLIQAIKSNNSHNELIKLDKASILEELIPQVKGMKEVDNVSIML